MRVVTLLPAATEIVCALGLRENLVGRSHECDFPADVATLPALTRARVDSSLPSGPLDDAVRRLLEEQQPLYALDEAGLSTLAPDVVVTQEACAVCAVSYDQVVGSLNRTSQAARIVSLRPSRLAHILNDVRQVAEACDVPGHGAAVVAGLQSRLAVAQERAPRQRPRVAVIEWLEPPMLAGHWVPDSIEAAGGAHLGPQAGTPSPYASWEQLGGLSADAVIVAPCGFDLQRTIAEARPFAAQLRRVAPRVLLMDGNAYLNRPGPRIVEAIETIAAWLHGEAVPASRAVALEERIDQDDVALG
jgi:iron complex transport system substrate-binding protein